MKILLGHNKTYYPALGGGDKSNRELMEALVRRGHQVHVVARTPNTSQDEHEKLLADLAERDVPATLTTHGVVTFTLHGVQVYTVTTHPNLRGYFSEQILEFNPDIVITSTDDPAHILLDAALRSTKPTVFLARATLALPFGPDCAFPSEAKTETLRRVDSVVTVSNYVARYCREFGAIDAVYKPIALQGEGPFPELARFENQYVTMVNPCAVKGLPIFLELARRFPDVEFAAVPTWGTGEEDRRAIDAVKNVKVLPPADNINDILAITRIMLVPSLWAEARSRIVVESMLRGVPVLASNAGGLVEAKMGVDYLLPVNLIQNYRPEVNEHMVPLADIPAQDVDPWEDALRTLLTDRASYEALSKRSREVALAFPDNFDLRPFEQHLEELTTRPLRRLQPAAAKAAVVNPLEHLSPEKRALLALRLKQGSKPAARKEWFVAGSSEKAPLRLFCFPYAGGGTAMYRTWQRELQGVAQVMAALLPGREARVNEKPLESMEEITGHLQREIAGHLDQPYVLFGHSMGAGIAFELTRELRRASLPLPRLLLVSGARPVQLRTEALPDPGEAELLEQLRRLQGIPEEVLQKPELMRQLMPVIQADTRMYRRYVYREEAPLEVPIVAYAGREDANIAPEVMDLWGRQTVSGFEVRVFPGGHFYMQTDAALFLKTLREELMRLVG